MYPDSAALRRLASRIHLVIKEISDRLIVEGNMCPGAGLFDELHVFDQQ